MTRAPQNERGFVAALASVPRAIWSWGIPLFDWTDARFEPRRVPVIVVVAVHAALVFGAHAYAPDDGWVMSFFAALLPIGAYLSWQALRMHRRPLVHFAHYRALMDFGGGDEYGRKLPFWFIYRTACILMPSLFLLTIGFLVVWVLLINDSPYTTLAFNGLAGLFVLLLVLVTSVGVLQQPMVLLPKLLREAMYRGRPISKQKLENDYRHP